MSLRSGLAFFASSASSVARFVFRAADEESSVDDTNDAIGSFDGCSLDGDSLGGGSSDGGDVDDSPKDDGSPDGSSSADGSPKASVPQVNDGVQEGDGSEEQEQLRLKENKKKNNLASLVWLVVFHLLVVAPLLLVDGSRCDHVNANVCNLTEDVISYSDDGNARINVDYLLVTAAVSCNSTSKTLSNFCSCQSQVQSNSSVSLTVEAHTMFQ